MAKIILAAALSISLWIPALAGQSKSQKAPSKPVPTLEQMILQNSKDAPRRAAKSPNDVPETVRKIIEKSDLAITERRLPEAKSALESVSRFLDAYGKTGGKGAAPVIAPEAIKGRMARLAGIDLVDSKDYAKGETTLREALELSKKAADPVLEAGVHNNLGVALRYQGYDAEEKMEASANEFDTARKMAEEQKDSPRAGSYNYNLGQVLLELRRAPAALEAFKRSADQSKAAAKPNLQAKAIMFQGVALGRINAVGSEPIKYFDNAHQMFAAQGDNQNAGWSLFLIADHYAYSAKHAESVAAAERAIPFLQKAEDKAGLARCYNLLSDMYARLDNKEKSESYKTKAAELSSHP